MKELIEIQAKLNAPKNQRNKFGGYNYRSCEDILAAVKPLLTENHCTLMISDEIFTTADRVYIKATATLKNESGEIESTTAYAREGAEKKGMDESQITGAASSYARKYALNGLFAIDDTKDADATNTHGKDKQEQPKQINKAELLAAAIVDAENVKSRAEMAIWWAKYKDLQQDEQLLAVCKKLGEKFPQPQKK
jgi:hypothetical protein